MKKVQIDFHGRTVSFETNRIAKQAGGSVLVTSGDSVVLVTACVGAAKAEGFLPLTIDYIEKAYASGKIPGGYIKREGRLSEHETLTSRLIDRPMRPLFPEAYSCETQVTATVMSSDPDVDTDILALCGASCALSLSEAPFMGPVAGVRVCRINGKLVINPSPSQREGCELDFIVAGTQEAITMVEGGANQIPENEVLEALFFAHKELQAIIKVQEELVKEAGKPKMEVVAKEIDAQFKSEVEAFITDKLKVALKIREKGLRGDAVSQVKKEAVAKFITEGNESKAGDLNYLLEDVAYKTLRLMATKDKLRVDGRDFETVRPISIDLGLLPRSHGSSLFTRGETQAIVVCTLGVESDAQMIDALNGLVHKRFMLHYNFPPFSVGETKPLRGPGRREIGHGALAERALRYVLPDIKDFPYVMRIVSEITESNGSSSMASVCGGVLAMMDAGVPLKASVAGVAMGLIKEGDDFVVLTDILGDEDHLGDMDFKICGTETGVTAVQMDIKISGLTPEIMTQALDQAKRARLHILSKMNEVITEPRKETSEYAPRIITFKINPGKVRELIGPGGKVIKSICETHGVKMDITDDGKVSISGTDKKRLETAVKLAKSITAEAEVGKLYEGVVKRIADFGAFVEILPGTDGLLHISEISEERIRAVTDVLSEGDPIQVKVLGIDRQGKIKLTARDLE